MNRPRTMTAARWEEIWRVLDAPEMWLRHIEDDPLFHRIARELKAEIHAECAAHDASEQTIQQFREELASAKLSLTETAKEASDFRRLYDKAFKERDEARSRWVLDPIHKQLQRERELSDQLAAALNYLDAFDAPKAHEAARAALAQHAASRADKLASSKDPGSDTQGGRE